MRILYISQYFPPEIGATQNRALEMALGLRSAGHEVTMLTEFPCHPLGVIPVRYRGKVFERSRLQGIEVIRTWVRASPSSDFRSRLIFYSSFAVMSVLAGLLKARGRFDLLYATSPPLPVGGAGLLLSLLLRLPIVFEVRDLWPECAVTLGELRNRAAIAAATGLENLCYRRAARIVVTAREMVDALQLRGVSERKISIVFNGSNTKSFRPDPAARLRLRRELGLGNSFVVLYAGLHGLAQDLERLLETAESLREEIPEIRFLFVGDGPRKSRLERLAEDRGLSNVTFLRAQPVQFMPAFFNAADVTVASLKGPHLRGTVPSKIFDSMACGVPVIVTAGGEAKQVVEGSAAGLATPPGDVQSLRTAILKLLADPDLRAAMGRAGRATAEKRFSRQAQALRLSRLLEATLSETGV